MLQMIRLLVASPPSTLTVGRNTIGSLGNGPRNMRHNRIKMKHNNINDIIYKLKDKDLSIFLGELYQSIFPCQLCFT